MQVSKLSSGLAAPFWSLVNISTSGMLTIKPQSIKNVKYRLFSAAFLQSLDQKRSFLWYHTGAQKNKNPENHN